MAIRVSSRKNMRRQVQQRTLGFVVIGFAIIVAALILRSRSDDAQAAAPVSTAIIAQYDTILVPVPEDPIPAGTKIKAARFRAVSFPRHQVPEDAILNLDGILEAETKAALPANLPLFPRNLNISPATANAVVERIPPGMRAMTISVNETSSVEGWAQAGSVVDVLLVERSRTTVVAEKVRILSAARSVKPGAEAAPKVPSTVTLLVTQEQCLAINTAIPLGKIAFALRSSADEEQWGDRSYTAANLQSGNANTTTPREIKGYISVKGAEGDEAYALSDGRWVKTEVVPDGFFASSNE